MTRNSRGLIPACAGLALAGCGMFGGGNDRLAQVDDLVTAIERVHVESEIGRERTASALVLLQRMTQPDFHGDAVLAHAELLRAADNAAKQAKDLRYSVESMQRAAGPVFARWDKDLAAMATPELKARSAARRDETKQRYDAIVKAAEPMLAAYDAFNRTVRDHALFLGHDFNPSAVAALAPDVAALGEAERELNGAFGQCMQTARAYVDGAALPMRVEAARPAPR